MSVDIIGKFSPTKSSGHKFIVISIDYFAMWVEAKSLLVACYGAKDWPKPSSADLSICYFAHHLQFSQYSELNSLKWELFNRSSYKVNSDLIMEILLKLVTSSILIRDHLSCISTESDKISFILHAARNQSCTVIG